MDQKNFIASWQEAHSIVDEAMTKGDRSVSIMRSRYARPMSREKSPITTTAQNSACVQLKHDGTGVQSTKRRNSMGSGL